MAMIDYGALLRKDGKFINKNKDLFMETSDTGYVCKKAINKNGIEECIDGNYYVYVGDKNFLVVFYKGIYKAISNGKIILSEWNMPFISETHFLEGLPSLKVSRLSPYFEYKKMESWGSWEDYVRDRWINATGYEKLSQLKNGTKHYKMWKKHLKKVARHKGYKHRPQRFLAEWDYNGHHYEVIFGYGIDPDEKVWNRIKNESYGFRKDEIELIDSWFEGE